MLGAGGIYNLPSHLSPGARDLIPRMLLVDPLKRITIPEIRSSMILSHPSLTSKSSKPCPDYRTGIPAARR
jgi:serine/threonine protein kinase